MTRNQFQILCAVPASNAFLHYVVAAHMELMVDIIHGRLPGRGTFEFNDVALDYIYNNDVVSITELRYKNLGRTCKSVRLDFDDTITVSEVANAFQ